MYFASLKNEEGRPIFCTVNYVDPEDPGRNHSGRRQADCWNHVPFDRPLPFDVRTLSKLARAADPAVSSLAVFRDSKNKLFIWGMVDQEPRHCDFISLEAARHARAARAVSGHDHRGGQYLGLSATTR